MEEFGYNKSYKFSTFMGCGYPVLGLLGLLVYWVFFVEPSRGSSTVRFEFEW